MAYPSESGSSDSEFCESSGDLDELLEELWNSDSALGSWRPCNISETGRVTVLRSSQTNTQISRLA